MLSILLTILKIIGILILCILGLVLGIVLLILLVPIRYDAKGELYEEKHIGVRIHWLLHLLMIAVQLRGKAMEITVKVLGITLFATKKGEEEETTVSQKAASKETEALMSEDQDSSDGEDSAEDSNEKMDSTEDNNSSKAAAPTKEQISGEKTLKEEDLNRTFMEKIEDKLNQFADALAEKLEHLEQTVEELQEKIEKMKNTVSHYWNLVSHERTKNFIKRLLGEVWGIVKYIAPTKLKANLHVGMDNPYTTGNICMFASMLYPVYKDTIKLEPDFEEKILEGTFFLKGRIRLGHFMIAVVRIIANRDFWFVIRHIKPKEDKKTKPQSE